MKISIFVSPELILATQSASLAQQRAAATKDHHFDRDIEVILSQLSDDDTNDLKSAATLVGDSRSRTAIDAISLARQGNFSKPLPNVKAFHAVLTCYLKSNLIDGWIYVEGADGHLYPELVTGISFSSTSGSRDNPVPCITLHTTCFGHPVNYNRNNAIPGVGVYTDTHLFYPQSIARRTVATILANSGIHKETPELKATYAASLDRHKKLTLLAFGEQFLVNGTAYAYNKMYGSNNKDVALSRRKVIHDTTFPSYSAMSNHVESSMFDDAGNTGAVPVHPIVSVFDLHTHEHLWVNTESMTPYAYDKSLCDKLILPATHKDLLDVLTTDLDAFIHDFIEGKSAGNVILCKGVPGVGKTLTAECYAERIERPLYSISAGTLGTTAESISKNLQEIFLQAKRWGCVLLLDEADVFVVRRGKNIEQNAIVAEFLKAIEYFDGLLFMTTNRPDDIDDAIISRCAAIISYAPPCAQDAAAIWRVMANQYETDLSESLIGSLVTLFPAIAPRDIKMLLRLALRIANSRNATPSIDIFRQCAMFRAITINESTESNASSSTGN